MAVLDVIRSIGSRLPGPDTLRRLNRPDQPESNIGLLIIGGLTVRRAAFWTVLRRLAEICD